MRVVVRGCFVQVVAQLPGPACAEEGEESEEDACHLEPEHSREPHERSPEGFSKSLAAADETLSGLPGLGCCPLCLLPDARAGWRCCRACCCWILGRSARLSRLRFSGRRIGCRRRIYRCHQRLCGCTGSYTKSASEAYRIHTQSVAGYRFRATPEGGNLSGCFVLTSKLRLRPRIFTEERGLDFVRGSVSRGVPPRGVSCA